MAAPRSRRMRCSLILTPVGGCGCGTTRAPGNGTTAPSEPGMLGAMPERAHPSRRTFLGLAASGLTAGGLAGCQMVPRQSSGQPKGLSRRSVTPENSLPGDPHWPIRRPGAPDEIMGYAGRASVRAGEPVELYVSTTAREFRVVVFRIGW